MSEKLTTPGSMEIADRLDHCAKYTGLDAVRELLQEAAQAVRKRDAVIKLLEGEAGQATQAEVTDADIFEAALPFGAFEYGDAQGDKRIAFARAILSLRPAAVPMTQEQIMEAEQSSYVDSRKPVYTTDCWGDEKIEYEPTKYFNMFKFARAIEAHHGITAQAKGEQ